MNFAALHVALKYEQVRAEEEIWDENNHIQHGLHSLITMAILMSSVREAFLKI